MLPRKNFENLHAVGEGGVDWNKKKTLSVIFTSVLVLAQRLSSGCKCMCVASAPPVMSLALIWESAKR